MEVAALPEEVDMVAAATARVDSAVMLRAAVMRARAAVVRARAAVVRARPAVARAAVGEGGGEEEGKGWPVAAPVVMLAVVRAAAAVTVAAAERGLEAVPAGAAPVGMVD